MKEALDGMEYTVRQPNFRQLRRVAFISAVPFVGFGIMDNAIMIVVNVDILLLLLGGDGEYGGRDGC